MNTFTRVFFLLATVFVAVMAQTPTAEPTAMPTIYEVNIESGYLVGMTSRHVTPVITIIPFFITIIALILLCCFFGGQSEFLIGWTGFWLGLVSIFFSCVQFAVSAAAYSKLEGPWVGSWWIGISCFFAVLISMVCKTRTLAAFGSSLLIAAFMIGIICTVGDGLYYSHVLRGVKSCTNKNGENWSIISSYEPYANQCHLQDPGRDLACIHRNHERCYYFDGIDNGHTFFSRYTWLFETAFVFDILQVVAFTAFFLWYTGNLLAAKFLYQAPEHSSPAQAEPEKEVQLQATSDNQV
jgi:hypothetical protein